MVICANSVLEWQRLFAAPNVAAILLILAVPIFLGSEQSELLPKG